MGTEKQRRIPSLRHHKPTAQAVVTLNGKDYYLGKHGTAKATAAYNDLIARWLANDRMPIIAAADLTVTELTAAYLVELRRRHTKGGKATRQLENIGQALTRLRKVAGRDSVAEFGPPRLKAIRQVMVDDGLCRRYCNKLVNMIRAMFRWGVEEGLVPSPVSYALDAVQELRRGQTTAVDHEPVGPVEKVIVEATVAKLPKTVADMVAVQQLTGCRPEEVCKFRRSEIDMGAEVWEFRPSQHKTAHLGHRRTIFIGPKAQAILRPYLARAGEGFLFSPRDSEQRRRQEAHEARRTPLSCGNKPGRNSNKRRNLPPGDRYTTSTYRRAIRRAADKADQAERERLAKLMEGNEGSPSKPNITERLIPRWSPNRLRHSAGTEIRKQFGVEAAQTVLGHATAATTQIYAERDEGLARKVAAQVG